MSISKRIFISGCVVVLLIISVFIFRNAFLEYFLAKASKDFYTRYGLHLTIGNSGFEGVRNIYVRNVTLVPPGKDTLLTIANADVKLNMSKLFRLRIGFNEVFADSVLVNIVKYDSLNTNYSALLKRNTKTSEKKQTRGFNDLLATILEKVNDLFNENVVLQSVMINYTSGGVVEQLRIPELLYDRKSLKASLVTASKDGVSAYIMTGTANSRETKYDLRIVRTGGDKAALPFFDRVDNFKVVFDTLFASLEGDPDASVIPLNASLRFKNLTLNHWRISPVDVLFSDLELDLKSLADHDRFTAGKGTTVRLARLPLRIDGYYERKPDPRFVINMAFDAASNDFFASLPPGMFNSLQGFKATGKLHFNLSADININKPEEVKFSSSLKKENFKITQFGQEYFPLINSDFQFTAMDRDVPVRKIIVGSENPMFTRLEDISPYLRMSVLTSEDPSFMNHNGFVEESFRESIAKNVKERRFARGGSTISMQLVKNLFLSRNKTISRKLEEAMVVWIIEQNDLVSKERMLEVYLNIIEWGPDVYGVGEASRFYFSKLPKELGLAEGIFLARIIPHPKYFKYMFDSTGTLKENQKGFYSLISNRLLNRNQITQQEFDQLIPSVKLNGQALNLIVPLEPMPTDSLKEEDVVRD